MLASLLENNHAWVAKHFLAEAIGAEYIFADPNLVKELACLKRLEETIVGYAMGGPLK